jgi:hypothetical protein
MLVSRSHIARQHGSALLLFHDLDFHIMNNNLTTQEEISIMDLAVLIVKRKKSVFISLLFLLTNA